MLRFRNWLFYSIFLFSAQVLGAPAFFSYQGQIVKPNGAPLEAANVHFTIDVLSHGAERCLLYQERHLVNMTGSNGIFTLEIGSGSRTGTDYEDTNTLANALSNATGLVTPTTCASVGSYNPNTTHGRKLRVTFNDGSGAVTLSQLHNIVSVPYAVNASSIDGLTTGDLLTRNTSGTYVLTQTNLENIFDGPNHTELLALLGGTSSLYMQSSPAADFDMNSHKIVNVDTPTVGTDAANKNYVDANLGGMTLNTADIQALTVGNAGEVLTWSGSQWVSQTVSTTDNTKLPLGGGTMTGAINMGNENISNANDISAGGDIGATGDLSAGANLTVGADATVTNNLTVGNDVSITGGIGVGTGINSGGPISLTNGSEINFRDADDSNFVGFAAPAIVGADLVWTLPAADGTPNQVLQTDGSGMLNWVSLPTGGETNTASNVGAGGVAVFKQKTGVDFEFRSVNAGSTKVTITNDAGNNEIDINVDEAQFALGTIPNTPAGNIAATNAQAAINELDTEKVATTRTLGTAADSGLTGGGDLSANRSLSLDIPGTTNLGAAADDADSILVYDASGSVIREVTRAQFNLSEAEVDAFVADNGYAADADKVDRAGDTMTGDLALNATIELQFNDADNSNYVGFVAPAVVGTNMIWTLPAVDGTPGQVLETDGSGVLQWKSLSAVGETNTGSNVGTAGVGVFDGKVGVDLQFKNVAPGSGKITITDDAGNNEIDINVDETQFALGSIPNTPAGNIAATNAQAAINELDTDKVATTRTLGTAADSGLSGGGDLSANRSFSIDIPGTTDLGAAADNADSILVYDASGSALREVTRAQFNLSETEVDAMVANNGYATDADKVDIAGDTMTGGLIMGATGVAAGSGGTISFKELAASAGDDHVGFRAPDNVTTSVIWELPAADGTAGHVLQTDGAGVLSWVAQATGSDDLGNHTATTDLLMNDKSILGLEAGTASAPGLSFNGDANTGLFSAGADSLSFATAGTEHMVINSSGNVGIGTDNPYVKLQVNGNIETNSDITAVNVHATAAGAAAYPSFVGSAFTDSGSAQLNFQRYRGTTFSSPSPVVDGDTLGIITGSGWNGAQIENAGSVSIVVDGTNATGAGNHPGGKIAFMVRGTAFTNQYGFGVEAMTIRNSGNIGIGTAAPMEKLDVEGRVVSGPKGTAAGDGGSIVFEELAANGTASVGFRAPDDVTTGVIWQLPATDGTTGHVLQTNGAGVLSWVAQASGSDDLGDHTATTDLDMANSSILNLEGGSASAPSLSFNGDSNTGLYSAAPDTLSLSTAGIEGLTIGATGNVGIGTATPDRNLHVSGPSTWVRIDRNDNTYGPSALFVRQNAAASAVQSSWLFGPTNTAGATNDDFAITDFGTATTGIIGTPRIVIKKSNGDIGIGTTSATAKLDVEGRIISGPKGTAAGDGGSIVFEELVANGTATVGFRAPDDVTTGVIWQLPAADGTSGHVLRTNGAGVLSWVAQPGGPDNLGNHTATADLGMANNSILNLKGGTAGAPGLSFNSDSNTGLYSAGSDTLSLSTAGVEAMFVNSSGHIGIGTGTPNSSLHVQGNSYVSGTLGVGTTPPAGSRVHISTTAIQTGLTVGTMYTGTTGTGGSFSAGGAATNNVGVYATASGATNNYAAIFDQGNVGIGISTPSAKLSVVGNTTMTYTGGDTANPLEIDATGSTISNKTAFAVRVPATGSGKAFGLFKGTDTYSFSTFEYTTGGAAKPGLSLGDGATDRDTSIYRNSSGVLRTPGSILADGNIGVGTTNATSKLHVAATSAATSGGNNYGSYHEMNYNPTSATTGTGVALQGYSNFAGTTNSPNGTVIGVQGVGDNWSARNIGRIIGVASVATNSSAATVTDLRGLSAWVDNTHASGTTTNAVGVYTGGARTAGTITNAIGVYVDTMVATNKWGVYQVDSATPNYFNGSVGIGTLSPGQKLDVNGQVLATGYLHSSDRRLKTNIRALEGLALLRQLEGVRFQWRTERYDDIGFIAQDVEKIYPELVSTNPVTGYKSVKYGSIVAPLVESVKELDVRCEATERDLASLKSKVDQLSQENQDLKQRLERLERLLLTQPPQRGQ